MTWPRGTARAIARSIEIYYRDAERTARMDSLNGVARDPDVLPTGFHEDGRNMLFRDLRGTHIDDVVCDLDVLQRQEKG